MANIAAAKDNREKSFSPVGIIRALCAPARADVSALVDSRSTQSALFHDPRFFVDENQKVYNCTLSVQSKQEALL